MDIRFVGVEFAGFISGVRGFRRVIAPEVTSHGLAIKTGLTGEFADIDPSGVLFLFTCEIFEHKPILRVEHLASTSY